MFHVNLIQFRVCVRGLYPYVDGFKDYHSSEDLS